MKFKRIQVVFAVILAGSVFTLGQTQPPAFAQNLSLNASAAGSTVRDPQAIALVEQALAALGGADAQQTVRTAVIRGTMQTADSPDASSFLWEDDLSGKVPEFRKEIRSGNSVHVFISGHGEPAHQKNGRLRKLARQVALAVPPLYLPGVILAGQLRDQSRSFQFVNDNSGFSHVRTAWNFGSATAFNYPQDWYLDPSTKLPVRVQYMVPSTQMLGHMEPASMDFSDFRVISGIAVPFKIIGHGAGQQARTFAVTSVQTNTIIGPTHFELNGGQQ